MSVVMNFICANWVEIVGIMAIFIIAGINICRFLSLSKAMQIEQIKGWLLNSVVEAEKLFGGGTGKIKLSYVYDRFVEKFPWLAKILPFDYFAKYVDDVLIDMRKLLESNSAAAAIVSNGSENVV